MRLHIFHGGELGHIGRTGSAQDLVRNAFDARFLGRFLEDTEQEVVSVDGRAPRRRENEGVRFTSPLGEADGRRDTREPLPRSHILEADKPSALAGALPGSTRCSWHPPDTPNPGMAGPASPQSLFG